MSIFDTPNRVPGYQRSYQASTKPIYIRGARGRLYYNTYLAFWALGATGALYGIRTVVKGKKSGGS